MMFQNKPGVGGLSKRFQLVAAAFLLGWCASASFAQNQPENTQPQPAQPSSNEPVKPPVPRRVPERNDRIRKSNQAPNTPNPPNAAGQPQNPTQPQPGQPTPDGNAAPDGQPANAAQPPANPVGPRIRPTPTKKEGADGPAATTPRSDSTAPADADMIRRTQEALTPPTPGEQPAQPAVVPQPAPQPQPAVADQPVTPSAPDIRKTAAQRAAERRKQLGENAPAVPGQPIPNPAGIDVENPELGPSTAINIPPIEDNVPPEKKTYSFGIKDGTYEQLVEGFARQTGLGVIGDIPKEGRVSFVTTETLSFDQALGRIRMLLFNYKPHEPYWILREENNLKVVRINDIYRVLPPDRMFRNIDAFRAAKLGKDDLALVIYTPKSGSIADLRQVRDFLPDYVRIAPVENSNSVSIFALVSDIEKYLWLIDFFANKEADPRTLVRIEVRHISPSEALTRLTQLMSIDASGVPKAVPASGRRTGVVSPNTAGIDTMPEPAVTVVPDDVQGVLIVRAMQDKIDEIKGLLTILDVDMSGQNFQPVIIKLQHADAETVVSAIQQVLQISANPNVPGPTPQPGGAKAAKPKRNRGAVPAAVADEGQIHMFAHPIDNAIVVLADEAGVQQVRELVPLFDVKTRADWVKLPLEFVDAGEAANTLMTVLSGAPQGAGKAKPANDRFQLIADPSGTALWFSGEQKDLDQAREVLRSIDVREDPVKIHVATLKHQTPTFIANMLREMDQTGGSATGIAPANMGKKNKKQQANQSIVASKFTADDVQKKLFVFCTDKEWQKYAPIIEQLEKEAAGDAQYVRIPLKNLEPQEAIDKISGMMGGAGDEAVNMVPADGSILVFDTDQRVLDKINLFLGEIDHPSATIERTFEIRHANAADIKTAIETLAGDLPAKQPKPRKAKDKSGMVTTDATVGEDMTVLQVGDRLVVRASPKRMERVEKIVKEFDVVDSRTEMKVYADFPRGSDIAGIADTIRTALGGGKPGGKKKDGSVLGGGDGPQFIPQPTAGKLIVIAEPAQFVEVEKLLNVLRTGADAAPPVVEFIELKFADPTDLVEAIQPLVEIKVRELVAKGELTDESLDDVVPRPQKKKGTTTTMNTGGRFHISPDARNNRIVVAAPQVVVDQVRELVAQFDRPAKESDTPVFKTIELVNASPADMVRAVNEMRGRAPTSKRNPAKRGDAIDLGAKGAGQFVILEAPGGGSKLVLQGPAEDVDQAVGWIQRLDAEAAGGRTIKIYEPKHADPGKLVDFIVNVVESSHGQSGGKIPKPKPKKDSDESDEDSGFTTTRTYFGQDLYLQADLISGTIMVASTPAKIKQIDDIMARFESEEFTTIMGETPDVPTLTYELKSGRKAESAVTDLEILLQDRFPDDKEPPKVTTSGIGEVLLVRYPKEDRFPEIEKLIEKYIDKPDKATLKIERKAIQVPPGLTASQYAAILRIQNPHLQATIIDKTPTDLESKYNIREIKPKSPAPNPCVLPSSLRSLANLSAAAILAQPEDAADEPSDGAGDDEPVQAAQAQAAPKPQPTGLPTDLLKRAGLPVGGKSSDTAQPASETEAKSETGNKKKKKSEEKSGVEEEHEGPGAPMEITVNPDGSLMIKGAHGDIQDILKWQKEFAEEDVGEGEPDIRIFQVQYIDVFSAARVIEEMFNATSQQRAAVQTQAEMARRAAAANQARQQPGQGQPGQEEGAAPGPAGQAGARGRARGQQPQPQQPQMQVPQLPPATVRVYPNPRDRTLIFRADTKLYPQILKLLATVDQPKPINSVMRTYPLKKLNAPEVEEWLKQMLGMGQQPGQRARAARPNGATPGGIPGAMPIAPLITEEGTSLPTTITQKTATGDNFLNVDPDDITLISSDVANAIMVMAPEAAQDYIKMLIDQLESRDIPERITKVYELKHADSEELAEYLTTYFTEQTAIAGKGKRPGGPESAPSSTAKALNTPSFLPYARLNQITVHATAEQIKEIDELIARFDVSTGQDQWQNVTLQFADATVVADTLASMFTDVGGGGSKGRGAASGAAGVSRGGQTRFIGDPVGRVVYYIAPKQYQEQIVTTIQKMENEAKTATAVRIIELRYATPSAVAEAIESAFTGRTTSRGRSSGASGASSGAGKASAPRFTVVGHDPSKRLFITADDHTFSEIQSLVTILDQQGMASVEFRIYPLQFANAKMVHGQMTKLLTDFIKRLPPGEKVPGLDAFSVEPDETSNSLVVLGSPSVFGFIEENLRKIDTPGSAVGKQASAIIPVTGNAQEIAQNIKAMYAAKDQSTGSTQPIVEANPTANVIIVRGTQAQIDEIKRDIIAPLEGQGVPTRTVQVKPIKLKFADPNAAADAISKMFRTDSRNTRDQVIATGDYTSNSVIVSASPENMKRVEDLMSQIDSAELSQQDVHVVEIKHADAASVAQTLTEIFVRGAAGQKGPGAQGSLISIAAVQGSRAILIKAKAEEFARIEATIKELDSEQIGTTGDVRVVTLLYADANEVVKSLETYLTNSMTTGGKGPKLMGDVRVSAMPQSNSVMISAATEEVERLVEIVKGMDIAGEKGSVPQIIPLKYANVGQIMPQLQEVFNQQQGGPRAGNRNQPPPVIAADEASNVLIVRASPTDFAAIEGLVAKLDTPDQKDKTRFRIIPVKPGVNVTNLAEQVQEAINHSAESTAVTSGTRFSRPPNLSATPDTRTNTIILAGSPVLFADAEAMIRLLEEKGPSGNKRTVIVPVTNYKVEEVQRLVEQLTQQQDQNRPGAGSRRSSPPRPMNRPMPQRQGP